MLCPSCCLGGSRGEFLVPLLRNLWDGHPRWGWRAISVKKPMFQGGERHTHVLRGFSSGIFSETILVTLGWSEQTALTWAPPALPSSHPPLHTGQRFCRAEELHSTQSPCPSILQVPEPQIPAQTAPNPLPHPGFSSGSDILRVRHAVGIPPEF